MASQIEVSTHGASEKEIALSPFAKRFVVTQARDRRRLVLADSRNHRCAHTTLIPRGATLIGAGRIGFEDGLLEAFWGSISCCGDIGYDRPADAAQAAHLLIEIKNAFQDWYERVRSDSGL